MLKTKESGLAGCLAFPSFNVASDIRTHGVCPEEELHHIDGASSPLGREHMFQIGVKKDSMGT